MATGLLQILYTAFSPDFNLNINVPNSLAPIERIPAYAFATGNQSLSVPTGALYLLVQNIVNGPLALVGASGDTGYAITTTMSNTNPPLIPVVSGGIIQFNAPAGCKADLTYL